MTGWIGSAGVAVAVWLGVAITSEAAGMALAPAFRRLGRLYAPPGAGRRLALTWLGAAALTWLGVRVGGGHPGWGAALVLGAIPTALLATLVYRDHRRAAAGLPPVGSVPRTRFGPAGRAGLGVVSLLGLGVGALSAAALGWDGLEPALGGAVIGGLAGYAALRGRAPAAWLLLRGAPPERAGSDAPAG